MDGGEWVVWASTAEVLDFQKKVQSLIVSDDKLEASLKGAKVSHQRCH